MNTTLTAASTVVRLSFLLAVLGFLILLMFRYVGSTEEGVVGGIDIRTPAVLTGSDSWVLDASAEIELPNEMRQGLYSGVRLEFVVTFKITEQSAFLWRRTLSETTRRYTLIYYELTRHYRLVEVDTGTSRNFRSLLAALDELGELRTISVPAPEEYSDDPQAHLSVELDSGALPLPLQSLWSSTWRLSSREQVWPVF
ncbi:MAG: DUF4390 domain-containing protein [Gammaproteobacteria bacterium]|nr:DUF4390 domain-containing protein [Gammaproteobacteria bacterium]